MDVRLEFRLRPPKAPELDVNLMLSSEAIGLSGPSGIGKTTLLRILAGLERRAVGRIQIDGAVWQDSAASVFVPPWERRTGWVPQDALLFPHLTVRQNLLFGRQKERGGPALDEVVGSLDLVQLLSRRPRFLSGGERQRVALGRALLSAPKLLLLDEPFTALDRPTKVRVAATLRKLHRRHGMGMVLVTHDADDLRELTEASLTLMEGRLVVAAFDQQGVA